MKAIVLAAGVIGLGAVFAMFEPARASATQVTSEEVQLLSEQVSDQTPGRTCVARNPKGKGRVSLKGPGFYPLR